MTDKPDTFSIRDVLRAADRLREAAKDGPDPLKGADTLYYGDDELMAQEAWKLVHLANKHRTFAGPMIALRSPHVPPGYIVGKRADNVVLLIGPEPKKEAK